MEQYVLTFIKDIVRLSAWLLILLTIFIPVERLFPLQRQRVVRKEFFVDLLYYFLNNLLPKALMIAPMALVAWAARHVMPAGFVSYVATLPLWAKFAAAMVVGETGFYWGHRWTHEVPFLWRFHAVHHSAEEMDWLVNTRAHPLDMVFTRLCGFVPLYILGLANPNAGALDTVSLLFVFVSTLWGFFVHANVKWRFGPFEWLLSTPAFHHWHHTYSEPINKNYAAMLPFLDMIFGTHYNPKHEWPARYGTETPVSQNMGDQLLDPVLPSQAEAMRT